MHRHNSHEIRSRFQTAHALPFVPSTQSLPSLATSTSLFPETLHFSIESTPASSRPQSCGVFGGVRAILHESRCPRSGMDLRSIGSSVSMCGDWSKTKRPWTLAWRVSHFTKFGSQMRLDLAATRHPSLRSSWEGSCFSKSNAFSVCLKFFPFFL